MFCGAFFIESLLRASKCFKKRENWQLKRWKARFTSEKCFAHVLPPILVSNESSNKTILLRISRNLQGANKSEENSFHYIPELPDLRFLNLSSPDESWGGKGQDITLPKTNIFAPWKWMLGIPVLLSIWETLFSGAMLNFREGKLHEFGSWW